MSAASHEGRAVRRSVRQESAKSHKRKKSPPRQPLAKASPRHKPNPPVSRRRTKAIIGLASALADDFADIVERPDGFRWVAPDGKQEFGPFETRELARADRDRFSEQALVPGETLEEAEEEIGIAGWIDPETGAPAEGQSPPYLEEE